MNNIIEQPHNYGAGRPSQNSRSPQRDEDQINRSSPLRHDRSPQAYQGSSQPNEMEEQRYEERRREELRRQIREREQELSQITQSKDRLRMRIQNSLSFGGSSSLSQTTHHPPVDYPAKRSSPLRSKKLLMPPLTATLKSGQTNEVTLKKPPTPSSFKFNIQESPHINQKEFTPFQPSNTIPRSNPGVQNDYNQQLQTDNTQLQRRLNLVVAELDRVTREKNLQQSQLASAEAETSQYLREIQQEQMGDKQALDLKELINQQKTENQNVKKKLEQTDEIRLNSVNKLNQTQNQRERSVLNTESLSQGLSHKLQVMKELDAEKIQMHDQAKQAAQQIQQLERELKQQQPKLPEIQHLLDRLRRERDDHQLRYNKLNETYEHAVHEISNERAKIESQNRRHMQLMSAKALFKLISIMVKDRKQASINEFFNYCQFDRNCHYRLKQFAIILQNCGELKMKLALKKWFQTSLKPVKTIKQQYSVVNNMFTRKLKHRMLRKWINRMVKHEIVYDRKEEGVLDIWRIKHDYVRKDILVLFLNWREETKYFREKNKILKFLVLRQQTKVQRIAFSRMLFWNVTLEWAMREHTLVTQYAIQNTQLVSLHQLKFRTAFKKRVRLMKLAHLWKAWKDSNIYHRYMMAQNVSASHLLQCSLIRLKSQCFTSLRLNKESEKFNLMVQSLNGNFEPAVRSLEEQLRIKSMAALLTKKRRYLELFARQLSSKMASYFYHWKFVENASKQRIQTNLKEIITRLYRDDIRRTFNHWKMGHYYKLRKNQSATIAEKSTEGKMFGKDVAKLTKSVENEKDRQYRNTRSALANAALICRTRHLLQAIKIWHNRCSNRNNQEQGSGFLIQKMRSLLLKQAFNLFLKKSHLLKQEEKDESRCQHFLKTRQMRNKRKTWNAIFKYVNLFKVAKRNWHTCCYNIDLWSQRKAFSLWAQQANVKAIQLAKQKQNDSIKKFDQLNVDLGSVVKDHDQAKEKNNQLKKKLIDQAKFVLANAFARHYYSKAERGMKKWKDFCSFKRHLENIVRNRINQHKKNMWIMASALFKNWVAKSKHEEIKNNIMQSVRQSDEQKRKIDYNRINHECYGTNKKTEVKETKEEAVTFNTKFKILAENICKKNKNNFFQSKRRYIFLHWRQFAKRQVGFINSLVNVTTKRLWQDGFDQIRRVARDNHNITEQRHANRKLNQFYLKILADTFSQIRSQRKQVETFSLEKIEADTQKQIETHEEFVNKVKDYHGELQIERKDLNNTRDVFKAWKNVYIWQKSVKDQKNKFNEWTVLQARHSMIKWHLRTELTQKCRRNMIQFNLRKAKLYKKAVIDHLLKVNHHQTTLAKKLSDIAGKFDSRAKETAYRMIKGFVDAKIDIHAKQKAVAGNEMASLLHQMYLIRMTKTVGEIRYKTYKAKDKVVGTMFGHWYARSLREYFLKFKNQTDKLKVLEDVNDEGPVVEEVLRERMRLTNLKNFLVEQGYTPLEILKISTWAKDRSKEHLARGLARIKHATRKGDAYLKPKMFDRWRQYVKQRKLIGYLLQNMNNKLQPSKADLSIAFNRWRYNKKHLLAGIDRQVLASKCGNDERHKQYIFALEDQGTQFMNQMAIQRDELIQNYMKSTRLAVALMRDNHERGQRQALEKLSDHSHNHHKFGHEIALSNRIQMIQQLKDRIRDFEGDNDSLANENEELRQFSLYGYQIAKNVQSLSNERENLSVDLADKAHTIQKLLDQNAELSRQLKAAQENAIQLINQSSRNMSRLQTNQYRGF